MPEVIKYQKASNDIRPTVAKIVRFPVEALDERKRCVFICSDRLADCRNYAAVLTSSDDIPVSGHLIQLAEAASLWQAGDVVQLVPTEHRIVTLYKQAWHTNGLYVTDLCNSHCIMCPQPPQDKDSVSQEFLDSFIDCLPNNVTSLGVTGGEPTMIGDRLVHVLQKIARKSSDCQVQVLSNARRLKDFKYAKAIADSGLKKLFFGVPLYSSVPEIHDFIVQSKGAFQETCKGVANLERLGVPVEIRIVLHKQVVSGLRELVQWLFFNMPYACHIAIMGMENMGYVKKNWDSLWISPKDYQTELYESVQYLHLRGMNVSIFNLPRCLLDKRLWQFARDSISDFKVSYTDECNKCVERERCGGLFSHQKDLMPIKAILR